jgi:capsid protein
MEDVKKKKFIEKAVDKFNGMLGISFGNDKIKGEPQMEARSRSHGVSSNIFSVPFDGEKNLGEIGPIKDYFLQYDLLRLRSWQSYLESEITQTVLGKYTKWIIGSGLKLQSEPNKTVLESEGINEDLDNFTKNVEARFGLYSKSKTADHSGMSTLNSIAKTAYLNSIVGGDVLVVLRLVKGVVKVQLIDGEHVRTDRFGIQNVPQTLENGNIIINGIEMSSTGEHISYRILNSLFKSQTIRAKTKSGLTQAFLIYGFRYRLNNHRGLPLISVVLEPLKKLERYKEATVGSAEERQKIAFFIEHGVNSTGENPMGKQMAKAFDINANDSDLPKDINGTELANTIAATTNKETYNMPQDSTLKQLESKNELHFKDFYNVNIDLICASIGIPPEVAMSKYDSNFSASRAALKDWEHTILIERQAFKEQFYQNVYLFWLEFNILQNNVSAPGYLISGKQSIVKQSYQSCRFIGAGVPHIDPLKEVEAERAKLGPAGAQIPLTTVEKSTEALNAGDSEQNLTQFIKEVEDFKKSGIEVVPPTPATTPPNDDDDGE